MTSPFFGRDDEIRRLRAHFDAVTSRQPGGGFEGPRFAVVIAESGFGKSRLVQELYHQLTSDPVWDPDDVDYWPEAFGGAGEQLRVNPEMRGHEMHGPPRFLWLGARWTAPDQRNVDTRSALPDLRTEFKVHTDILERHQDLFTQSLRKVRQARQDLAGEVLSQAADAALPLGGLLLRGIGMARDALRGSKERERSAGEERDQQLLDIVGELQECFRSTLEGRGAVPVVLWLDDAQWMDAETRELVGRLWTFGQKKRWPLLIVVTHWEREWRELLKKPASEREGTLAAHRGVDGFDEIYLGPAGGDALRALVLERLPGISRAHQDLLLEKAGGNFLSMVENVADLIAEPMHFEDEDLGRGLSEEGEDFVRSWETERQKRVEQRFRNLEPKVRHVLGWSSRLGQRFLAGVVAEFAERVAAEPTANDLMDWCVDPGSILGAPSPLTREFRDKAFHEVAAQHFQRYGRKHEEDLRLVLREHLISWINASYREDGTLKLEEGEAPEASMAALWVSEQWSELRDLVDMAQAELPLESEPDWECAEAQASLRAIALSIANDGPDGLWQRVRQAGQFLEAIDWSKVPTDLLDLDSWSWIASALQTS
ncbi:MAG: hypothetical protein ACO3UM_14855, partial [Planctomycetota bacterium]